MIKRIKIENIEIDALIDTGSEITVLRKSDFKKMFPELKIESYRTEISGIGSGKAFTEGKCIFSISVDKVMEQHDVIIVPDEAIKYQMIIGFDFIRPLKMIWNGDSFIFEYLQEKETNFILNMNLIEKNWDAPNQFNDILDEIKENYSPTENYDVPVTLKIVCTDDKPISCSPSKLPLIQQKIVNQQVKEWMEKGVIRPSTSEYSSRVLVIKKKDGSHRVCIDYRRLNKVVFKDRFPAPDLEGVIDKLQGSRIYSKLDLENGFFHVKIEEESKKFTAFVTQEGIFEFNRAPFGFCNCPAVFSRYVNFIFQKLINENVMALYMDDIIIYSDDEQEGLRKLKLVLDVAAKNRLKIKWSKCKFMQTRIEFLGYQIENGIFFPGADKIAAIEKFPLPKNIKDVQIFLGLTGFFHKLLKIMP